MVEVFEYLLWSLVVVGPIVAVIASIRAYRAASRERDRNKDESPPPTPTAADDGLVSGIAIGGLYAAREHDGRYTISKVLAVDFAVHVRLYRERFDAVPAGVSSAQLTVAVGHAPLAGEEWLERHELISRESVSETELEGYRLYLEG